MPIREFRGIDDGVDRPPEGAIPDALDDVDSRRGRDDDRRGAGSGENEGEDRTAHGP
jgi:hypothetical protein